MSESKVRKMSVELTPVQMIWLHSQHLFQKIEQQTSAKFFKHNAGVEIKGPYGESESSATIRAQKELLSVIHANEIRLIQTSLDKLLYIKISKEARKEFPSTYIIFLHYETFENCSRKLQQKFNITSIAPELERRRKQNPNFCFLIADKTKIEQIEKFTARILHSELSCASTTFSQQNYHRRELANTPIYKRAMSVSSLKGSFSDHNEEQCRLSLHPTVTEEEMFEVSQVSLVNLSEKSLEKVVSSGLYEGCCVYIENYDGSYMSMKKKLYYANRLQLAGSPHLQPIYAYSMLQKNTYRWRLSFVTDKHYRTVGDLWESQWLAGLNTKIEMLLRVARALLGLHARYENYGDLCEQKVLIDDNRNILLSCVISKDVPPHTDPFIYDIRRYLLLLYRLLTEVEITYEMLLKKENQEEFFCTMSHRAKNQLLSKFLNLADKLFIRDIGLGQFVRDGYVLLKTC